MNDLKNSSIHIIDITHQPSDQHLQIPVLPNAQVHANSQQFNHIDNDNELSRNEI